ncbi:MAG: hypothetical protein BWK73_38505 [Thiothrix lacustris]|jgi:plasmid replication initiation protein|uniref:Initiator Rep protein WH1 domain-containing protein n=1 Tax=Thiothrix lacustris TaxID=525917 RepID=A0A1Y1QES7_9GAMM|nr:MAG: hypothetical protein BWK73_38505 [Thiothrix lacustris]
MGTVPEWLEKKAQEAVERQKDVSAKVITEQKVTEKIRNPDSLTPLPTVYGYDGEVNMSRILVKAAHGLNLSQKRLIMYAVSKIHPHAPQPAQLVVRVDATDYARDMDVWTNHAYRDLQDSADALFDRYISISRDTPKGREIEKIHWVSSAKYHAGEGWVEIRFTPEVSPYLSMLNDGNQVIYKLQTVIDIKSVYAWRLMELLMQWQDTKRLYIKLEDYRHALEIPETYRYVDVRLHCIEKPIQELREKCQIDIQWTPIKDKENKRRVGSLEFTWKSVEQIEIPLEGGEKPKKKRGRKPKEA